MADEKNDYAAERHEDVADHDAAGHMSISTYFATRLSTLKPPITRLENPIKLLRLLNRKQWLFFSCAFIAWSWDAFDFFTVSLTVGNLADTFGKTNADITWGITLVLMFRSLGAVIFGLLSDRFGRKWPFVVNNLLFMALELGTGFCNTYRQFLACRALFGVAMGGLYGNIAAMALEDCPPRARGIISGILQQGYAFGYLLATVFSRALVNTTPYAWRPLYWFGGAVLILIIAFRLCLGETDAYEERQRLREVYPNAGKEFVKEGRVALQTHWLLLVYLVLLMAGFNFMSHGTQDLYPTMLVNEYNFSPNAVTVTQVVANLGAIAGGTTVGYLSQSFGRRFSIIIIAIIGGALLYPYSFTSSKAVIAAAFLEQFCVQGAWGPGSLRVFVVGTSFQLGNLVSSASSTIEATIGERFPLPPEHQNGKIVSRYQYGKVICIFVGCVFAFVILMTFLGPERRGRSMDVEADNEVIDGPGPEGVSKEVRTHRRDSDSQDFEASNDGDFV